MPTATLRKGKATRTAKSAGTAPARTAKDAGTAPARRAITAEDLLRFHFVGDPQVSPDGSSIAFVKKQVGQKNDYITNIWLVDTKGGEPRQFTNSGKDGHPRWSPSGDRIAFIGGREKAKPQIHVISQAGGEALPLTKFGEGTIASFRWSPDGRWIAAAFRESDPLWTEEAKKERSDKGLSDPPRVLDDWWYRLDGDGYFNAQRYHLYLIDAKTGKNRLLFDRHVMGISTFDFSPDSKQIVVVANVDRRAMVRPWMDKLFRIDVASGKATDVPNVPVGPKDQVRWSPDGKKLAWAGREGEGASWGVENTNLFVCDAVKGVARNLSKDEDYCLTAATLSDTAEASFNPLLFWSPDSRRIFTRIGWHGQGHIASIGVDGGRFQFHTEGEIEVAPGNISDDGATFGLIVGSPTKLVEVYSGRFTGKSIQLKALTDFNGPLLSEVNIISPKSDWVPTPDGTTVQVWSVRPAEATGGKKVPAILEIHGGPHAQYGVPFFHEFQLLAAQGYAVFYSNPRGSKGYGESHTAAIKGSWGQADWTDIQAVITFMKKQPWVDTKRMGVMGGSYGGYMTNWVIGHTKDFKAAITDRCVSNLVSMLGTTDFAEEPGMYWPGNNWDDIDALWEMSPVRHFGNVETPTLIIHSEGDLRCNIEQAEQVFTVLKLRDIPVRFVRYPPCCSHGMSRSGPPDLRLHRLHQILDWWKEYLGR